jgi:hypothetical protein
MGIFASIFGTKTECYQCEIKLKESQTLFRRGLRFCKAECVAQFVQENPPKIAEGNDLVAHRQTAIVEMNTALDELSHLVRATGGSFSAAGHRSAAGNVIAGGAAVIEFDEAVARVGTFYDQVRYALPYLYALGLHAECEVLETIDLDPIMMMSRAVAAHGGLQQGNMRRLAEESYQKSSEMISRLAVGD